MMQHDALSATGKTLFKAMEFDDAEELIYEIRKDPVGLIVIYATGLFIAVVTFLMLIAAPMLIKSDPLDTGLNLSTIRTISALIGLVLISLSLFGTFLGAYLYKYNVVIITSEKIAQIQYTSLFNRNISQL